MERRAQSSAQRLERFVVQTFTMICEQIFSKFPPSIWVLLSPGTTPFVFTLFYWLHSHNACAEQSCSWAPRLPPTLLRWAASATLHEGRHTGRQGEAMILIVLAQAFESACSPLFLCSEKTSTELFCFCLSINNIFL